MWLKKNYKWMLCVAITLIIICVGIFKGKFGHSVAVQNKNDLQQIKWVKQFCLYDDYARYYGNDTYYMCRLRYTKNDTIYFDIEYSETGGISRIRKWDTLLAGMIYERHDNESTGFSLYLRNCSSCHGFDNLEHWGYKNMRTRFDTMYKNKTILEYLNKGPFDHNDSTYYHSFTNLTEWEMDALHNYLFPKNEMVY